MKARWRYSDIVKAAEQRIRDRYASQYRYVGIADAPHEVATNLVETDQLRQAVNLPVPTVTDVLDALVLVNPARAVLVARLEDAELTLIEAARQAEVGWNEIGDALGYAAAGAGVSAKHRYRTLLAKFPSREPRTFTMDTGNDAVTSGDVETSAENAATGR